MGKRTHRKNRRGLDVIQAVVIATVVLVGMSRAGAEPSWLPVVAALAAGATAFASKEAGVIIALVALALPTVAANALVGILFVVVAIIASHYLESDGPRTFIAGACAILGALFGPVWTAPVIAGYTLGRTSGPLVAALACLALESFGLAFGKEVFGATAIGAHEHLLVFKDMPDNLLSFSWAKETLSSIGMSQVDGLVAVLKKTSSPLMLAIQPALWAGAAWLAGRGGRVARRKGSVTLAATTAAAVTTALAAASAVVLVSAGHKIDLAYIVAAVSSILTAAILAPAWDRIFPLEKRTEPRTGTASSMAMEDADVDELLSLIASAEEKLASDHAATRVVMITDMKSFSKMTEEEGSMFTAKAIQKHRDLLLPIIDRHGGKGKSTGGDGLLAAFETAENAIAAAVEMQRVLQSHNETNPHQREMTIRIGIAQGEVMLDRHGRPFIGVALNLAARVMNLADGGQAFVTSFVAAAAPEAATYHSHGEFELKNISKPVEILEIVWHDELDPIDPRTRES